MNEYGFGYEDVEKVRVNTFRSAARLSKIEPKDTDEAQYNIAWPVASALVFGDVGYPQVRDEALKDERVLGMMKRLSFEINPELDAQFPGKRLAFVEIELKDGRLIKSKVYEAPGEMDDPELNLEWIQKKFKRITRWMLDEDKQDEIIKMMANSEGDFTMRDLVMKINRDLKHSI